MRGSASVILIRESAEWLSVQPDMTPSMVTGNIFILRMPGRLKADVFPRVSGVTSRQRAKTMYLEHGTKPAANEITGANAGGPRLLLIRTRSAARIAQFCRYPSSHAYFRH